MTGVAQELLQAVRLLVDRPEAVRLDEVPKGRMTQFELQLASEDLGKVIGRYGLTVRALRSLLQVRGDREGEAFGLEILE